MTDMETTEISSQETSQEPDPEIQTERQDDTSESPTYLRQDWGSLEHYICLRCGHEDWSLPTLEQHMQAYHAGKMVVAPEGYEPPGAEEETAVAAEGVEMAAASDTEAVETVALSPDEDADKEDKD